MAQTQPGDGATAQVMFIDSSRSSNSLTPFIRIQQAVEPSPNANSSRHIAQSPLLLSQSRRPEPALPSPTLSARSQSQQLSLPLAVNASEGNQEAESSGTYHKRRYVCEICDKRFERYSLVCNFTICYAHAASKQA